MNCENKPFITFLYIQDLEFEIVFKIHTSIKLAKLFLATTETFWAYLEKVDSFIVLCMNDKKLFRTQEIRVANGRKQIFSF